MPTTFIVFFLLLLLGTSEEYEESIYALDILLDLHGKMPKEDENVRQAIKLPMDKTYYVVGFETLVPVEVAHHVAIVGCPETYHGTEMYVDCSRRDFSFNYVWARGAPPLYLPAGVGFKFGKEAFVKGVLLGIHFKNLSHVSDFDASQLGVRLIYTDKKQPKEAKTFNLASYLQIPPNSTERVDIAYEITDDVEMHVFAYRPHTHPLGKVVAGYVVRANNNNQMEWTLIGKKDPLLPQDFYPTTEEIVIQKGDILAARCTMFNFKNITVSYGPTNYDEMCVFYLMYWIVDGKFPSITNYVSLGPPGYRWETDSRLSNIPKDSDKL